MTGRTHDLAAFTTLNIAFILLPPRPMSFATAVTAFGANMIGGLLPDIDDANADIWDKIRGGSLLGRLIKPIIGEHRMLSHSLLGMTIIGLASWYLLGLLSAVVIVDMNIVWWSLMIGYVSHLATDTLTTQGVPWLFPIPFRFGLPPMKRIRIKTGGWREHFLFFPALILTNAYLVYANYPRYIDFIRQYIR